MPEKPVGGDRLGECGPVLPADAPRLPDDITAAGWLLADLDSGAVLAGHDPHGRQRPASVIKLLLAMAVVKEWPPNATVVATAEDIAQECTCVGLREGGEYTVEQLLEVLMMVSGNDVAHALARKLGGVPAALAKMNALAADSGALDTRAASPSGLDAPGMSTSPYDMALILRAALKHPRIARAVATRTVDFPAADGNGTVALANDNRLLTDYEGTLGGKTGFTDDAQHTFVGAAQRGGRRLAVVLLRGSQQPIRLSAQAALLLDYGFALPSGQPVGHLVDGAPRAKAVSSDPTPTGTSVGQPLGAAPPDAAGSQDLRDPDATAFGTVGGPITAVTFTGLALTLAVYWRKRRARTARPEHERG
ncbi:D-alanyl-D-alanine carboxypeptidase (penicillin-binding protein 5/6) [Saccharothrix tamanrassetensis]|uniref:D-alanyl-D-alanine carboxypeptidase (Penicillin-binding protein 5/6) n=1 Tax=Saccharothrix tamanrassetensis TaxID=1051531 RepID=A0A841CQ22_9PSEU|nr:D-alanyl-D-alanine carboxypeptidase (penicillin-binding protein 5/6) [Saccharothrix tamanrassetensis]